MTYSTVISSLVKLFYFTFNSTLLLFVFVYAPILKSFKLAYIIFIFISSNRHELKANLFTRDFTPYFTSYVS